jgi:sulfur-carrier protein
VARLVFLGRLEDLAGSAVVALPLAGPTAWPDLLALLPPSLAEAVQGPKVRLALNGAIVGTEGLTLGDADELAFLPPVSGG